MSVLADSNILLRVLQRHHPMHAAAWAAVRKLNAQQKLVLAPQKIVELWVVATRPIERNGLGMAPARAAMYLGRIGRNFPILHDTPEIYHEWKRLVVEYHVSGKKAHDTRVVAAMNVQ